MNNACLITGTDTEVGKTYITCLLIKELRAKGINAIGFKPVSSGDRIDAKQLAAASEIDDINLINPYHFDIPVAPLVAATVQGTEIDADFLRHRLNELQQQYDYIVIEGAGGWKTPYLSNGGLSALFPNTQLPVILVIGNKLGAINHTLLSYEQIKNDGFNNPTLILNNLNDELDNATITNGGIIESILNLELAENVIQEQTYLDLDAFPFLP